MSEEAFQFARANFSPDSCFKDILHFITATAPRAATIAYG
jgi:hypothetical protein